MSGQVTVCSNSKSLRKRPDGRTHHRVACRRRRINPAYILYSPLAGLFVVPKNRRNTTRKTTLAAALMASAFLLAGCAGASPEQQAVSTAKDYVDIVSQGGEAAYCDGKPASWASGNKWNNVTYGDAAIVDQKLKVYQVPVKWNVDGKQYDELFTVQLSGDKMCVVTRVTR